jgi:hypothetical protein
MPKISEYTPLGALDPAGRIPIVSGGATRSITPDQIRSWIDVREGHGAVGDGETDDTAALISLRTALLAAPEKHHTVIFPPGHYIYTNNRWLLGVGSVTILMHGSKLQNVSTNAWDENKRFLNTRDFWDDSGDVPRSSGSSVLNNGFILADAAIGDVTVAMDTAGEETNFAVGDRVYLQGFNQQDGGYPPNTRYFQWNEIASVGSGTLTFVHPLHYAFRSSDWKDFSIAFDGDLLDYGKARVMNLDRANWTYPRRIEFVGGEILKNPNSAADTVLVASDRLILRGVKIHMLVTPDFNREFLMDEQCIVTPASGNAFTPDKHCDRIDVLRSTLKGPCTEAPSIGYMRFEDCDLHNFTVKAGPRRLMMRRNRIKPPAGTQFGIVQPKELWPIDLLIFEDNVISHDGVLLHALNTGIELTFTVGSAGADNEIRIADSGTIITDTIAKITDGSHLYASDFSDQGIVTRVAFDPVEAEYLIFGTWKGTPSGTWGFAAGVLRYEERGTVFHSGKRFIDRQARPQQMASRQERGPVVLKIGNVDQALDWTAKFHRREVAMGIVKKISVSIQKEYTGSTATAFLGIDLGKSGGDVQYIKMDLLAIGYAETRLDGTYSSPAAATLTQLPVNSPMKNLTISYTHTGASSGDVLAYADPTERPKFVVAFEMEPLEG